ncbi:MAG: hypothetical protein ACOYO1_12845 [Bacteroidales bacterium]
MKNEVYFKEMKTQLSYGLNRSFVPEIQKDIDLFYEQNKNLPEDEFYYLFNQKYFPIFEVYHARANYFILKDINKILRYFYFSAIIASIIYILYLLLNFIK